MSEMNGCPCFHGAKMNELCVQYIVDMVDEQSAALLMVHI